MPRRDEYHRRRAEGLCVECPRYPERGTARCDHCLAVRYARRAELRASFRKHGPAKPTYGAIARRDTQRAADHWRDVQAQWRR